ncbi:hypothetical protein BU14_0055s0013 [Porphyra umbilicalis]|uniref:Uncharacterized protein n=1 Tax=Porphyra umbilicalis TaxID=2786 RepID=A0A1X6PHD8_PORUM|nr:hypothetical protein BU14_0055s0013 [Porphyra umbilicalis]|eukprot:OSX80289.1 hypothetical protein BU14_0055s0013 [Porphyra umbilicalis]
MQRYGRRARPTQTGGCRDQTGRAPRPPPPAPRPPRAAAHAPATAEHLHHPVPRRLPMGAQVDHAAHAENLERRHPHDPVRHPDSGLEEQRRLENTHLFLEDAGGGRQSCGSVPAMHVDRLAHNCARVSRCKRRAPQSPPARAQRVRAAPTTRRPRPGRRRWRRPRRESTAQPPPSQRPHSARPSRAARIAAARHPPLAPPLLLTRPRRRHGPHGAAPSHTPFDGGRATASGRPPQRERPSARPPLGRPYRHEPADRPPVPVKWQPARVPSAHEHRVWASLVRAVAATAADAKRA